MGLLSDTFVQNYLEPFLIFAGLSLAFAVWGWIAVGQRMWRQRVRNAFADRVGRGEAPPNGQPYAVYLRAFRHPAYVAGQADLRSQLETLILRRHTGADGRNGVLPLESVLAEGLDKDMPLVGLGRKQDGAKGAGIGIVVASDAEWQDVVTRLIEPCALIVMTPSAREGTAWEIEQIGARPEWRAKSVYFMPNFHVEVMRSLQPFVAGYETFFGTGRFEQKKKPKSVPATGAVVAYSIGVIFNAVFALIGAIVRFTVDIAFAAILIWLLISKTFSLRSRWGKARKKGRAHGLMFPAYSAKGRLFVLDANGKPQKVTDLHNVFGGRSQEGAVAYRQGKREAPSATRNAGASRVTLTPARAETS